MDIHQFYADIGCYLEDLQRVMDDWDGWREREREREREYQGTPRYQPRLDDDDGLVSLLNGISTCVGYLMPKLSL